MKIFFIALGSVIVLMLLGISCEIANRINNNKKEWKSLADDYYTYSTVFDTPRGKYTLRSDKPITEASIKAFKEKNPHIFEAAKKRKESILVGVVKDMCRNIKSVAKEVFIGQE